MLCRLGEVQARHNNSSSSSDSNCGSVVSAPGDSSSHASLHSPVLSYISETTAILLTSLITNVVVSGLTGES